MRTRPLDMLYAGVLLVIACVLYWSSLAAQVPSERVANDPMWYPQVLLVLLGVGSLLLLLRGIRRTSPSVTASIHWRRTGIALVAAALYVTLFIWQGLVVATLVVVPAMSGLLGFRRPIALVALTLGLTACVWYGFYYLFHITPPGIGLPTVSG